MIGLLLRTSLSFYKFMSELVEDIQDGNGDLAKTRGCRD